MPNRLGGGCTPGRSPTTAGGGGAGAGGGSCRGRGEQADDDDGDQQPPLEHRLQAGAKIDAAAWGVMLPPEITAPTGPSPRSDSLPASSAATPTAAPASHASLARP